MPGIARGVPDVEFPPMDVQVLTWYEKTALHERQPLPVKASPPGSMRAVGTEIHLVNRLARESHRNAP